MQMEKFSESTFQEKLSRVTKAANSIYELSEWVIHHYREHYSTVVKLWFREIMKADEHRVIPLMYLANDVIQRSSRVTDKYKYEFGRDIEKVCEHMHNAHEVTRNEIDRILSIWNERGIYGGIKIATCRRALIMGKERMNTYAKGVKRDKRRRIEYESGVSTYLEADDLWGTGNPCELRRPTQKSCRKIREALEAIKAYKSDIGSSTVPNWADILSDIQILIFDDSTIAKQRELSDIEELITMIDNAYETLGDCNDSFACEVSNRKKLRDALKILLQQQEELIPQAENSRKECLDTFRDLSKTRRAVLQHKKFLE